MPQLYQRLLQAYGPQAWWPAKSRFEIMVGAILTQNTAWRNVEKAIANMRKAGVMSQKALYTINEKELAELIRPSGYFNLKAKRLKHFCDWYEQEGGYRRLRKLETNELRQCLLSVHGIGPETADDILLYAFERPVFVIDAYTRRLLLALQLIQGDETYEVLRQYFEQALGLGDVQLFNEYHALIVRHAKEPCSQDSHCRHCFVEDIKMSS